MEKNNAGASGLLGRVRVASPCPASWEAMEGNDRARFCRQCSLNVYNLSAMTRAEAESLVARTEGRLCGRFYRRADGTILTQDCPTGLRAVRRRVRRSAAAVFAALASLWTAAAGQTAPPPGAQKEQEAAVSCEGGGRLKLRRKPVPKGELPTLTGTALDPNGASIVGAAVTLTNEATKETQSVNADDEGVFVFKRFAPGSYTLAVEAVGFVRQEVKQIALGVEESLTAEFAMLPSVTYSSVTVGIILLDLDFTPERNGNGKTTFSTEQILKLPRP